MANRFLNNITINDAYTLPSTDGTTGQAIVTDGAGNLSFGTVAAGTADAALKITLTVKNVSGGTLNKGTLVRVAPTANPPSGNVLEVDVADNSATSTMPAVGILIDQLADDAEGDAVAFGRASGFSTSGYTEGDPIWVGSNGAFVGTKPTGSDLIQRVGQVIKVHGSNGSIEVFGAGRTNDVPNLPVGKIWVGTATNTTESTVLEIDETNNIVTVDGKIYYSNVFSQESDLPSATTYHGMFAHVHGTGYAYYAHAGAWVKLAKLSDINDATLTVTAGTGLSGGGTFTTNQSSDSAVTVNLDDTAVTPGTYGDADNTPQITIDQQGRITSATTVATAGAGSGGGGGAELSIERDVFTATANQTAFTITSSITSSSNTQVYIDGVYQAKSNYTTSGSTVTFNTGVPAGAEVEVVHFISVYSKVYTDTFTGDGSTVAYTASKDVTDENVTQVYIDGVYQSKDNYTTSGTTITFSTQPPNGSAIEVVHFESIDYSTLASNQFTGNGTQTDFTLTQAVDVDRAFVFIQGVYQENSTYSITGTTLAFTTAPLNGYSIEVITIGSISATTPGGGISWQDVKTADFTAVAGEGYFVNTTSAAITVTLPSSPSAGDEVSIVDYAGTADTNNIVITSNDNINGSSNDVKIDYERGGVSMVYVDATQGWIAYNANNETAEALIDIPSAVTVDYLVVAGGGGGGPGYQAGGGGAGGLRTSYGSTSGGGASAETALVLSELTDYTISIGNGGTGGSAVSSANLEKGDNGGDSFIKLSSTDLVRSHGGGGGASYWNEQNNAFGLSGGSGGGAGNTSYGESGGAGTTGEGYAGGSTSGYNSPYSGGGGGGASAAGTAGGASGVTGDGGDGLAVSITGSSVTYAGGGGAGAYEGGVRPSGGAGGGGAGGEGNSTNANPTNGTDNLGGGGGGAGFQNVAGANGGKGVIILRYPDSYTISETTSGGNVLTFTTDSSSVSGYKITTFTTGANGTIQFS